MIEARYAVLIVNFNSANHVIGAVESIQRCADSENYFIQILDNASSSEDQRALQTIKSPRVEVYFSKENLGYARGNNLAAHLVSRRCEIGYLVVMNPDVRLTEKGTIGRLINLCEKSGLDICGVQPTVTNSFSDGSIDERMQIRRIPTIWELMVTESILLRVVMPALYRHFCCLDITPAAGPVRFEVPSGAFFAIKAEIFRKFGGFDPATFLYGEELMLGAKVSAMKMAFIFQPKERVLHYQGASTGLTRRTPRRDMYIFHMCSLTYFAKHYLNSNRLELLLLRIAMEVGFIVRVAFSFLGIFSRRSAGHPERKDMDSVSSKDGAVKS